MTNTGKKQNLIRFAYLYWGVGRSSEFIFIKGILIFSLQDCHIGFLSNSLALNTGMGLFNEADKFKFCPPGGFIPSLCQPLAFSKHKVDFKSSFDEVWRRFFLCLLLLFFIVMDFFFLFVIVFLTFLRFSAAADSDDFIVFLGILFIFTGTVGLLWLSGIGMGTVDWSEKKCYKVEKNCVNNVRENPQVMATWLAIDGLIRC